MSRRPIIAALAIMAVAAAAAASVWYWDGVRGQTISAIERDAEDLVNALRWGDIVYVRHEVQRKLASETSVPGTIIAVSLAGVDIVAAGWPPADAEQLDGVARGRLHHLSLSNGPALVLPVELTAYSSIDASAFSDVDLIVGRYVPTPAEQAARTALMLGWLGYAVCMLGVLGTYAWFHRRYVRELARINTHLTQVGRGHLHVLQETSSAPEVASLVCHLNTMVGEIRDLMIGLRDQADLVAHELGTPLTRLKISVDELRKPLSADNDSGQIEKIQENISDILRLFYGVYELSRTRSDCFDFSQFQVTDICRELRMLAEDYSELIECSNRNLKVDVDDQILVFCERPLVRRLFENLLDNVHKYAPEGSSISILVWRQDSRFVASVANTGSHFPKDFQEAAFFAGQRARLAEHVPGLGLGLNLVRAVAAKHGWRVWIEPSRDRADVRISGNAHEEGIAS